MDKPRSWVCTSCGRHTTISRLDHEVCKADLSTNTSRKDGKAFTVHGQVTRCPNPDCGDYHLAVSVFESKYEVLATGGGYFETNYRAPVGVGAFQFLPTTAAPLSATVPASIQEDYQESYLIRKLSPKAAATLARRALQGMVRDFWNVHGATLHQELLAIQDRCAAELHQAMMGVKSIGNIGAHPERDISLIVEIAPGEAEQLLELIHLLDQEWYVDREQKRQRLAGIKALAAAKHAERKAPEQG